MPLLIDRKPVTDDSWRLVDDETDQLPQQGDLIVPLALLNAHPEWLNAGEVRVAPLVRGADDIALLLERLDRLPMIAIEFPVFRDGRGFSIARILRRAGYKGQLRACGQVARDQLGYLERCGFNAFEFSAECDEFVQAFDEISVHYQGSADDPRPIYLQH